VLTYAFACGNFHFSPSQSIKQSIGSSWYRQNKIEAKRIILLNSTDSRKISHWEVFLVSVYRLFLKGAFLLQNPPLFQSKIWIEKFTRKGA